MENCVVVSAHVRPEVFRSSLWPNVAPDEFRAGAGLGKQKLSEGFRALYYEPTPRRWRYMEGRVRSESFLQTGSPFPGGVNYAHILHARDVCLYTDDGHF